MTMTASVQSAAERRDALAGRLFEATLGAMDLFNVYLGDGLGLYRALADGGPSTSAELAARAGIDERYAREWLEQQAATGILEVEDAGAEAAGRRYRVPLGHCEVLLDRDSLNWMAGLLRLVVGVTKPLPALLQAFRWRRAVPGLWGGHARGHRRYEPAHVPQPAGPGVAA